MLAEAAVIGFIPVRDLEVAKTFYAGVLGLTVAQVDSFALVLRAGNDTMIRCVISPDHQAKAATILGWEVAEIHLAAKALRAAGVEPTIYPHFSQDADGVWTAPDGSMVVWFNDPFGNVLSLSQHTVKVAA